MNHLTALCSVLAFFSTVSLITSCAIREETPIDQPPQWAREAIWYQIFVERFHNGDMSNDPTTEDLAGGWPGFVPDDWSITPWTQDWHKPDPYFNSVHGKLDTSGYPVTDFAAKTSFRRYGGDLQGVIDKLDYITSLGVNAIYFNPINDSPSLHKFDARHWRHVDVNFGPDPEGDKALIAAEDPSDPNTWVMTSADKLFLQLIKEAKKRNIRIILDYSWNHTGNMFWAWQDVLENQENSAFKDWYWVNQFDDPATQQNEFSYDGWFGVKQMPEIRETEPVDHAKAVTISEGNLCSEDAKQHMFAVTRRWLDPNGDGDPSDGIDGYRLDVAAELPLGFWREYRAVVRSLNPDAYLIGEVWFQSWPDVLMDPTPFLQGDIFDAVMNYRWYRAARRFFADIDNNINASEFVTQLQTLNTGFSSLHQQAMMNMSASHDSPRLLTSFFNTNNYKFNAKPEVNSNYKTGIPDESTFARVKAFLTFQFTQTGAPQIYAGDEMGMWGSDDPHNRKPLIWPEFQFENESQHPLRSSSESYEVKFNESLFAFYQSLIEIRNTYPVLHKGEISYYESDDETSIVAYAREGKDGERIYIAFNMSSKSQDMPLPLGFMSSTKVRVWQSSFPKMREFVMQGSIRMPSLSATIVIIP